MFNLGSILGFAGQSGGLIGELYKIFYGERAWKQMAPSAKETADYEDAINDENATVAYLRQRHFQEDYLSPAAQIQSQAAGYQSVGINKMALAGTQPGASSASAPQAAAASAPDAPSLPGGIGSFFSSLLNYEVDRKRVQNDYELKKRGLDIEKERLDIMRPYYNNMSQFYFQRTIGQSNENSIFSLRRQDLEKSIEVKSATVGQLAQWVNESITREYVNNETASKLFSEKVKIDNEAAGQAIMNQMLSAQARYSDKYFRAVANLQEAEAYIRSFDSAAVKQYWSKKLLAYEKELTRMIVESDQAKAWVDSPAFKAMCSGKMTTAERTQFWGNLVGGVVRTGITAAGALGGAAMMSGALKLPMLSAPAVAPVQPYQGPAIPFN